MTGMFSHVSSPAAEAWAAANPADDRPACCYASIYGHERCTCWRPVFTSPQALPQPPESATDLALRRGMCSDCAFRKGSPERTYDEDTLLALPARRQAFFCHDGMRRPAYWTHPDGRSWPTESDDWQPPILAGIPYRANGRPALLCAGWLYRAARSAWTTSDALGQLVVQAQEG